MLGPKMEGPHVLFAAIIGRGRNHHRAGAVSLALWPDGVAMAADSCHRAFGLLDLAAAARRRYRQRAGPLWGGSARAGLPGRAVRLPEDDDPQMDHRDRDHQ